MTGSSHNDYPQGNWINYAVTLGLLSVPPKRNTVKNLYLILAIVGAIVPYVFFIDFFASEGLALTGFVSGLFVNGAAGGFSADLLITSAVFWTYLFSRNDGPKAWPFVLINLTIGLSCALPLYLYMVTPAAVPADATS